MLEAILRRRRMTAAHPAPDTLVPYALGADDPATARHVVDCATCRTEIEALQEAAGLLRGPRVLERRTETPDCPDELLMADFVDGRLTPQMREPVVAHLLTCGRCRALVKASSDFATTAAGSVPQKRPVWQRWALPAGLAAAAMLTLLLLPRRPDGDSAILREPPLTNTIAPVPLEPHGNVTRVERLVWSSVPNAQRYRVRLYDDQSNVVWQTQTTDTTAALAVTVHLSPAATYFWRVEAETEWRRWATSDLTEFRVARRPR
jgi:putative zinc finger protein